jgi:hypothetical protein
VCGSCFKWLSSNMLAKQLPGTCTKRQQRQRHMLALLNNAAHVTVTALRLLVQDCWQLSILCTQHQLSSPNSAPCPHIQAICSNGTTWSWLTCCRAPSVVVRRVPLTFNSMTPLFPMAPAPLLLLLLLEGPCECPCCCCCCCCCCC